MQNIYAPWRNMNKGYKQDGCVFCNILNDINKEEHILYKDEHCFIVMNKYPYSSGHILLIPTSHIISIVELEDDVWLHISNIMKKATALLCDSLKTNHINIGININEHSGANIPEHLHIHFVPRYKGDTNFMSAIFNTKVYSNDFDDIYNIIKKKVHKYL